MAFSPVSLGGVSILALEPAFGNGSSTEYLLNSFPFDQFGNNNSIAKTVGFWAVKGDANITTGSGSVTLTAKIIGSETYAFPLLAASTGTGATNGSGITSVAFLQQDDSRMLQLQLINNEQKELQLYAAPDTALTITSPTMKPSAAYTG